MPGSLYEQFRLARLNRLGLLDTAPSQRFDRITALAKDFYGSEIALVTLLDGQRQWFKSKQGLDVDSTPRSVAFCSHAILQNEVFIVPDASCDPRFANNPLVLGAPFIRFYMGAPIREPTGFKVGTLCVIDSKARSESDINTKPLMSLAKMVEAEIARGFYAEDKQQDTIDGAQVLRLLNHSQTDQLHGESPDKAFDELLQHLLEITGSPEGAIVEIVADSTDRKLPQLKPLSCFGIKPERLHELVRSELSANDSAMCGEAANLGEESTHRLVSPVICDGKMVGLLYLANRPGGYSQAMTEEVQPLAYAVGLRIERLQLERLRQDHRRLLENAVSTDAVTGLHNREFFNQILEQRIDETLPGHGPFSVCYLDLDHFSLINAQLGRAGANQVLRVIANRLQRVLRPTDVVARFAGDEFAILMDGKVNATVLERILNTVREPIKLISSTVSVTASLGVSSYPSDDVCADSLIRHAAQTMLRAKGDGKDGYCLFDIKSHQSSLERTRLLEQAKNAFESGQFELYFQPKVHLAEQRVAGFEGLIRWHHPDEGFLTPDRFLPHFDGNDCDLLLGRYVISQAIDVLKCLDNHGLAYGISVNLSPSHFLSAEFLDFLKSLTSACPQFLLKRLTLEILETTAVDDFETVTERVQACRDLGIKVSLDDFGTGFSSLSYFRTLPLDEIKIDRSFISEMLTVHQDAFIVESVVRLANQFGRSVVAEGIECQATADKLLKLGCGIGQGYYYSRPLPLQKALQWAEEFECQAAAAQGSVQEAASGSRFK